ncbi:ribonucleotide reductase-associated flavodoxin, putative [Paenisporosarcina quisquiliarum]|uniref:Flavodoxin n=1 Tax=Psychrobacillus psychrodurans TaxID=126157 RepID=A0A9X3LBF5_9BACI|nr:flavodoxin [Psychrobacillus psychrodurans]MCZ8534702.1 flavodoxin [Psychrobacillus psychrodurans]SEN77402.1 ribonucleotide reductase-associated flavodoxin, putative [Paenisporosarcina quisquiliarum]
MKAIICYLSYSGNTEEVAELLKEQLKASDIDIDMHSIGYGVVPNLFEYDLIFIGTFTWDRGSTPEEMKDFAKEVGGKPNNVYVFGSGDTQFGGDELFCNAVEKLVNFYNSGYPGLKIEQSPRGSQEQLVSKWLEGVLEHAEGKNIRS